jgi:hypothetical protein
VRRLPLRLRLSDDLSGRSLREAQQALANLAEYAREETPPR